MNTSIIVYADDILLLSPVDSHLQELLDICSKYGNKWKIKFNPKKSSIIEFGPQLFKNTFFLGKIILDKVNKIKYLGVEIPNNFDYHNIAVNKFIKVQHALFSLSYLGLKKGEISPFLQTFIYKTYCLSQFTYGLETLTLNKSTRNYLNISQNNLIRQILGLKPRCHMTSVLNALQLFNFDQLYVFSKLSFISTIKFNRMASVIYQDLCLNKPTMENKLKSFNQDIVLLESHFTSEISFINSNVEALKKDLKLQFKQENGLTDSVKLCLKNINDNKYFTLLINLTKSFGNSSGTNIGD